MPAAPTCAATTSATSGSAPTKSPETSRRERSRRALSGHAAVCQLSGRGRIEPLNVASRSFDDDTNKIVLSILGRRYREPQAVVVDLAALVGKDIFIRLVDESSGGWGHVNFDDFRLHDSKPDFPIAQARSRSTCTRTPGSIPRQPPGDDRARGLSRHAVCRRAGCPAADRAGDRRSRPAVGCRSLFVSRARAGGPGPRPHFDFRGHRRRRPLRQPQSVCRQAQPGERLGNRLRRRVGRRGAGLAVHSRCRRRRPPRRSAASSARRLGLSGHARDAEHVYLGSRRLAVRLPRRVHAFERGQARHAATKSARRSMPASGAITPRSTCSKSSPTARAIRGASISTTRARRFSRPA